MGELFNTVNIILGKRGGGKTLYALGAKYSSKPEDRNLEVPGFIDIYLEKKMKVLFIMTLPHNSYKEIPTIPYDVVYTQLQKWKDPAVYKIICPVNEAMKLMAFINTLNNLWNAAIFLEDTRKICGKNVPAPLEHLFIDSKQKNQDIYMMFHSWMQIPAEMYSMIDYIELFKVDQNPDKRESEMEDYFDQVIDVYERIKADGFPFAHLTIDTGNNG